MLCRVIVWDVVALGGNKKEGKLSGGNYVKAIYPGEIFRVTINYSPWLGLGLELGLGLVLGLRGNFPRGQLS